jgi:hypothetical protein
MKYAFPLIVAAAVFLFACFPEPIAEPYEPPPVIVDPDVEPEPAPPTTGEVVTDIIEAADPLIPEKVKPWIGLAALIAGWWGGNRRGTNVAREVVRGIERAKGDNGGLADAFDAASNVIRTRTSDRANRLVDSIR